MPGQIQLCNHLYLYESSLFEREKMTEMGTFTPEIESIQLASKYQM